MHLVFYVDRNTMDLESRASSDRELEKEASSGFFDASPSRCLLPSPSDSFRRVIVVDPCMKSKKVMMAGKSCRTRL